MSLDPDLLPALIRRLDAISDAIRSQYGDVPDELLNRRPAPDAWSIAQVLDHLQVINRSYYPLVEKYRHGRMDLPWLARFRFWSRQMGRLLLQSVDPSRRRKMKTFPIWEPAPDGLPPGAVARFLEHQEEFKAFLLSCRDLLEQGAIIHSPANRLISYSLADAFRILVTHEERHLKQAREVRTRLGLHPS